ncbi:MAG: glycosyltransferase family 2 protein [Candidatus Omnitrophota bacterium]|jgi:glycosyltransferase involved in cell wall biosynthesis
MKNNSVSAVVITLNEERNIEDCLASVEWADEIVVVDGGSTDRTVEIARNAKATVYQIPFTDFSTQKNAALAKCTGDWILLIDADERVTGDLAREILQLTQSHPSADTAYAVRRRTWFFGARLRYSGTQEDAPIRLFPREKVRYVQPVHEEIVTDLRVRTLEHAMDHYSTRDLEHYRRKLGQYVALEIQFMRAAGRRVRFYDCLLRPPAKFVDLYFLKLGILDGWAGFLFAVLSSWYDFRKFWGMGCKRGT